MKSSHKFPDLTSFSWGWNKVEPVQQVLEVILFSLFLTSEMIQSVFCEQNVVFIHRQLADVVVGPLTIYMTAN